jgi:predicted peptidase
MGFNKRLISVSGLFIGLLFFWIAGLAFGAGKPKKQEVPKFVPGAEVRIEVDNEHIGGDHFLVYVPSDYTEKKDWPVIFFYHGASGQPTTWPFKQTTGGKGFIIIGMGYVEHGKGKVAEGEYLNYVKRERKSVLEVKRYVSRYLKVDKKRLFITGFSKGGWHTSVMLECSAKVWAGAVIFAAGRSRNAGLITTDARKRAILGKPIYIGAGETDQNLPAAKRAVTYYERLGAKVTFEEFKGAGHSFDPSKSEILRKWLLTNSSIEDAKSDRADKDPG